jgi:hypothetical protein
MESVLNQFVLADISNELSGEKNITVFDSGDSQEFADAIKKKKFGIPLWKYAVILALMFLMTEVLLIRFL